MKIGMIFIDLLRINLMNVYDANNSENKIDQQIKKWGGTLYTSCYTPAPDTPRSMACLWSGQYPIKNGCDNRMKYPFYFLDNNNPNFLELFMNQGYIVNSYIPETTEKVGILPNCITNQEKYFVSRNLTEFLNTLKIEDNSITLFNFDDFHWAVSDCYAQKKFVHLGYEKMGEALELIEEKIGIDAFDVMVVFSDHGFKYREEFASNEYFKQLNEDRTKVFMFVHEKGDKKIKYNHKLCSIMDVYPTLCNYAHITYDGSKISGIDLRDEKEYEYILIEDHKTFSALLTQTIEYWGVRTKKGLACINCEENWKADYTLTEEEKRFFVDLLEKGASCFRDNIRIQRAKEYYVEGLENNPLYWDMSPRQIRKPFRLLIQELKAKIKNHI